MTMPPTVTPTLAALKSARRGRRATSRSPNCVETGRSVEAAGTERAIATGLLGCDGGLTRIGREQLHRCRTAVAETTQALTAGIDPAAVRTTLDTLDAVRGRAEQLLAGCAVPARSR